MQESSGTLTNTMISLEKLLARNLPCSRKEARRLLDNDRGDLPRAISPDTLPLRVSIAGQALELHDSFHLMLNKPAGCVTALSDLTHDTAAAHCFTGRRFSRSFVPSDGWISRPPACSCGRRMARGYTGSPIRARRSRAPTMRPWNARLGCHRRHLSCATAIGPPFLTCTPCRKAKRIPACIGPLVKAISPASQLPAVPTTRSGASSPRSVAT
jgi:hypothetical protein